MDFYLVDPAGEQYHFPVNPEEVAIRRERQFETVNILSLGEVDFRQGEKIKEVSFTSFLPFRDPNEPFPSYCRFALPEGWYPQAEMNKLNDFMLSQKPLRLIISTTDVNVLVTISVHNSTFRGGEPGDVYFDLTCRTWREVTVRTGPRVVPAPASMVLGTTVTAESRPDMKPVPVVYSVKAGDTLWKIAKLELGDGGRWREIYNLNTGTIGQDPDVIFPGQELVMPV